MTLNVLHVTNELAENGTGITQAVLNLARRQAHTGLNVSILAANAEPSLRAELCKSGVRVYESGGQGVGRIFRMARQLKVLLDCEPWDAIHCHTVKSFAASSLCGRPFWIKSVATLHNTFSFSSSALLLSRRPTFISHASVRDMRLAAILAGARMAVVHNGVPRHSVPTLPLPDRKYLLFCGGFSHRKGLDHLIRRISIAKDADPTIHLVIVGNRDRQAIEDLVDDLQLSRHVTFVGHSKVPHSYMKGAVALLVPSLSEPFGLVALEARMQGTPVIASNVGGLTEVLAHGRNGVLIDALDEAAWVAAILRVWSDGNYRNELAIKAGQNLDSFDLSVMEAGYRDRYLSLSLRRRPRPRSRQWKMLRARGSSPRRP